MLDSFIDVWKRVEKILEPFKYKNPFFFGEDKKTFIFRIWGFVGIFSCFRPTKNGFLYSNGSKISLRAFRHQWRYLTCSSDPKFLVFTNYMRVGWISVAYRPTSSASAKFKKSLIFRIWGFVGIFSWLRQKNDFLHSNGSKIFSTHFQTSMKVSNMFLRS